jgi:hypothetical protein
MPPLRRRNQSLSIWGYTAFSIVLLAAVVAANFSLTGGMIPITVTRLFDQREEPRVEPDEEHAVFEHRGRRHRVKVVNLSSTGAMVEYASVPHIGERIRLQILGRAPVTGFVRWVHDGRIGINFDAPLN